MPDVPGVVAKGDVKGFGWELIAHGDGDDTCYTVRFRESVVDSACAAPAPASVTKASLIYIDTIPFAVGIAGSEVTQVRIEYSIAYTVVTNGERQGEPHGSFQQATVSADGTEGRLFIAELHKGARLDEVSAAG